MHSPRRTAQPPAHTTHHANKKSPATQQTRPMMRKKSWGRGEWVGGDEKKGGPAHPPASPPDTDTRTLGEDVPNAAKNRVPWGVGGAWDVGDTAGENN